MIEDFVMSAVIIHAAQIVAVVAVVLPASRFLQSRPFFLRCLWLVVLLKCLTPPLVSSPVSAFSWISGPWMSRSLDERQDLHSVMALSDEKTFAGSLKRSESASSGGHGTEVAADLSLQNGADFPAADSAWLAVENDSEHVAAVTYPPSAGDSQTSSDLTSVRRFPWFAMGLPASMLTGFLVIAFRYVSCVKAIRGHRVVSLEGHAQSIMNSVAEKMKLKRRPSVWVTDLLFGPAVLGVLRPVIVLPRILLDSMTDEQLRPIVAHELVHIRRGDLWVGLCQATAQCVWWFWPPVWLANRRLTRATEQCCDEETIRLSGCSPSEYAHSLLAVIESKHQLKPVPVFPGMKPVEITAQRMERIMSLKQGSRTRMSWKSLTAVLLLALVVLPGAVPGQTSDQKSASLVEAEVLYQATDKRDQVDNRDEAVAENVETVEYAVGDLLERLCKERGLSGSGAKDTPVAEIWPVAGTLRTENSVPIWKNNVLLVTHDETGHERIRQHVGQLRGDGFDKAKVRGDDADEAQASAPTILTPVEVIGAETVVAIVNGKRILADEVSGHWRHQGNNGIKQRWQEIGEDVRSRFHEQLQVYIDHEVVLQHMETTISPDQWKVIDKSLEESFAEVLGHLMKHHGVNTHEQLELVLTKQGLSIERLRTSFFRIQKVSGYIALRIDPDLQGEDRLAEQKLQIGKLRASAAIATIFDDRGTEEVRDQPGSTTTAAAADPDSADARNSDMSDRGRAKNDTISVTGAVKNPGQFDLSDAHETRILDAIEMAGGLDSSASERVVLERQTKTNTGKTVTTYRVLSVRDARQDADMNVVLQAGDVISVTLDNQRVTNQSSPELQKKLQQKVSLTFDNVPFMAAVREIAMKYDVTFGIENVSQRRLANANVSMAVTDVKLENALTLLCDEHELTYTIIGDVIGIHAPAAMKAPFLDAAAIRITTRCYIVADLVVPIPDSVPQADNAQVAEPEFSGLVELIKTTVEPESWKTGGGKIEPNRNVLCLVIRQTNDVHDQIMDLLCELRKETDIRVTTEARLLQFNTAEQLKWLDSNITFQPRRGSHPWALLPMKEDESGSEILSSVGTTLAQPTLTAFVGQNVDYEFAPVDPDIDGFGFTCTAVPFRNERFIDVVAAIGQRGQRWDHDEQFHQIMASGQTLLFDVTDSTRWSAFSKGSGLSEAERETAERAEAERRKLVDQRRGRIIIAITPTVIRVTEEDAGVEEASKP
ncbi:MAG: SLBB domain-containing protein [Planctomycetaceae bacterium]|nr:SLBB domain-containing protein [Planctomycetaceae bacterium]